MFDNTLMDFSVGCLEIALILHYHTFTASQIIRTSHTTFLSMKKSHPFSYPQSINDRCCRLEELSLILNLFIFLQVSQADLFGVC